MNDVEEKQYLGQVLLEQGFKRWFLYMFKLIEKRPFILEPIHGDLFDAFVRIYALKDLRVCVNIPPRSAKTTLAKYLLVYALTKNPRCNFIYTSYSQELLSQIARAVADIFEGDVYRAMYPVPVEVEEVDVDPMNDFWKERLKSETGKNKYTATKIMLLPGGSIMFVSIGGSITGFGAGIRGEKSFSGALIIDDAQKPSDARSETLRKKTIIYYEETLLSRVNDSNIPIINIQQRLHIEDLSGFLINRYGFKLVKQPLIKDGICQLPSQYTKERLEELQINDYGFQAQYQQEPIKEGGFLIKTEKFVRLPLMPEKYDYMYIVADTAFTEKTSSDNSAFLLIGIKEENIYLLDGYCRKVTFPDLCADLKSFYLKAQGDFGTLNSISAVYVENKASGISLIQQLRKELPIMEIAPAVGEKKRNADKYARFLEVEADIASERVRIPTEASWLPEFLRECEGFTGGKQSTKDDFVDVLIYAIKLAKKTNAPDWGALTRKLKNVF